VTSTTGHATERSAGAPAVGDPAARPWLDAFREVPRQPFTTAMTDSGTPATQTSATEMLLEAMKVHFGHRVLDIGIGDGYRAALLCHRLGDRAVTVLDTEPGLVDRARETLAGVGFHPAVLHGDREQGAVEHAPYDRVLAVQGAPRVPVAWLAQTRTGGTIITTVGRALLRLTKHEDGSASGRFATAAFLPERNGPTIPAPAETEMLTRTDRMPPRLGHDAMVFLIRLVLPDVRRAVDGTGQVYAHPATGSWVRVTPSTGGVATLRTHGPRPLWEELLDLLAQWEDHGRPDVARYGLTVTPAGDHLLWLDTPKRMVTTLVGG
jgi:protein-L-isoaspartate O-methyltransferase